MPVASSSSYLPRSYSSDTYNKPSSSYISSTAERISNGYSPLPRDKYRSDTIVTTRPPLSTSSYDSTYSSSYGRSSLLRSTSSSAYSKFSTTLPRSYSPSSYVSPTSPTLPRHRYSSASSTGDTYRRSYSPAPASIRVRSRDSSPVISSDDVTRRKSTYSTLYSPTLRRKSYASSVNDISDVSSYSSRPPRPTSDYSGSTLRRSSSFRRDSETNGDDCFSKDDEEQTGLRNLGNTCFMNSVLQCLAHTKLLKDYFLVGRYQSDINTTTSSMKGSLVRSFAELLQAMWKSDCRTAISPHDFKSQIERFAPRFTGYNQQDAQEFLRYLLFGLHEDVNRVYRKPTPFSQDIEDSLSDSQKASESWRRYTTFQDSKVMDMFVGQLKSTLCCTTCGYKSVTFDPFWDLSLPIPKTVGRVTLDQCLSAFTEEETLDGDEKPTCAKCKTRRICRKSFSIYKVPKLLVLHLKRFSPGERYRAKLSSKVEFPVKGLDLSRYGSHSAMYNLYAVSNHSGSTFSGHYTAYCRHPVTSVWHEFNDSLVSKVSESDVVTPEAYILFYQQV